MPGNRKTRAKLQIRGGVYRNMPAKAKKRHNMQKTGKIQDVKNPFPWWNGQNRKLLQSAE